MGGRPHAHPHLGRAVVAGRLVAVLAGAALAGPACSSLSIARVQPENVAVGPGLRPIAVIQANAISGYVAFVPLPGGVSLDRVVNRMLIVAAKTIGADKVANLVFEQTPDGGIWAIRRGMWPSSRPRFPARSD